MKNIGTYKYSEASLIEELEIVEVKPTKEHIDLLLTHQKYYEKPGKLKIWTK